MDVFNSFFAKCDAFLPNFGSTPLKLGLAGGIVMIVLFLICLALSKTSKVDKYRKVLLSGCRLLATSKPITEENVDIVYGELKKHPENVRVGWSNFLDSRVGAPSDYIPVKETLSRKEFSGKHPFYKTLMGIIGILICGATAFLGFAYFSEYNKSFLVENNVSFGTVLMCVEFLVIPVVLYVVFLISLGIMDDKRQIRLHMTYESFCENLDDAMAVKERMQTEAISNNHSEIRKQIEEVLRRNIKTEAIVISAPTVMPIETLHPIEEEVYDKQAFEEVESFRFGNELFEQAAATVTTETVSEEPLEPVTEEPVRGNIEPEQIVTEDDTPDELEVADEPDELDLIDEKVMGMVPDAPDAEWVEGMLNLAEQACNDENITAEDLDTLGQLLEVARSRQTDPDLANALVKGLESLAQKYYEKVNQDNNI